MAFAAMVAAGAIGVFAQDASSLSPEEAVAKRQELMKANGGLARGAMDLTGDEATAAAQTFVDNFTALHDLFPEGSTTNSKALPAIWENWETFTGILDTAQAGAEGALAGAQAGDVEAYKAGVQTVMGTCNTCHQQFRAS